MKIGFCYDTKEDYGFDDNNLEYTDFVTLSTVSEIKRALEQCGHEVHYIGNVHKLKTFLENSKIEIDIFFNIVEGFKSRNREALVPSLLEIYGLPHSGSDAYGMAVTLNKQHTKLLVQSLGIPVPDGMCFKHLSSSVIEKARQIGFPLILKPNSEGGSMGLYLIKTEEDLIEKCKYLIETYGFDLLIESYIEGREITVPIIGNSQDAKALGVVAVLHENGDDIALYDSSLKYIDNVINTLEHGFSDQIANKLMEYSIAIHNFLELFDYSRMDFRVTSDGEIFFLEANPMPSLCRDCSFEQCGNSMGFKYYEVVGMIIDAAMQRAQSL